MYYQLPNGKVVQMTIDEYLSLDEKGVQYLLSINAGEYIHSPWADSALTRIKKTIEEDLDGKVEAAVFESAEEIETFFEEFFPEEFDDPDPRVDLDFTP